MTALHRAALLKFRAPAEDMTLEDVVLACPGGDLAGRLTTIAAMLDSGLIHNHGTDIAADAHWWQKARE